MSPGHRLDAANEQERPEVLTDRCICRRHGPVEHRERNPDCPEHGDRTTPVSLGQEGILSVWDHEGRCVGCIGADTWTRVLEAIEDTDTLLFKHERTIRNLLVAVAEEVHRQDGIHPDGYPATRDGVRLGIATAQDELDEALAAWRDERSVEGWPRTRGELIQVMGVLARTVRSINGGSW